MRTMRQLSVIAAVMVTFVIVTAACGSASVDKAGGPTQVPAPVTITAASAFSVDTASDFRAAVDALSKGGLHVDVQEVGAGRPEAEAMAIDQVRTGKADLGMVGSRAWRSAGVTSYDALLAPLLIDSYGLEQRVLESPLVDEMAAGLEPLGLVGIGVLPGDLRLVLSKTKPFRSPAEFAGAKVAISKSAVADMTYRALGATTTAIGSGDPIEGFDAVEVPMDAISFNGYDKVARFVTVNVRMEPRPIVVFMSKDAFAKLSPEQQAMLRKAVRDAIPTTSQSLPKYEKEWAANSCRNGVRFGQASDQEKAALRSAVAPVYAELERDALTKRLIDGITELRSTAASVDAPISCAPGSSPSPVPSQSPVSIQSPVPSQSPTALPISAIEGVWNACPTEQDIVAAGAGPIEAHENAGCTTLSFHRGVFSETGAAAATGGPGTYFVNDDRIRINRSNGEQFFFTWSVFQDTLIFKKSPLPGAVSPAPLLAKPYHRTGD